jgi:predicted MPP superfamily phosphohydrolase
MKKATILVLAILFIGGLCLLYARFIGPYQVVVEKLYFHSEKFNKQFNGIDIVHISDLHMSSMGPYYQKVADKINAINPDYIFITGDLLSEREVYGFENPERLNRVMDDVVTFLKSLTPKKELYIVRGNNDLTIHKERSNSLLFRLDKEGIQYLANRKKVLEIQGEKIALAGVDFTEFDTGKVADFYIADSEKNKVIQSGLSANNSYSHFYPMEKRGDWQNYTFSGKMKRTEKQGQIGVTFYSQFDKGLDRYYRLRTSTVYPAFYLSPHGTLLGGDSLITGVEPKPNVWYLFKINVESQPAGTHIFVKVWQEGFPEPQSWQAEAMDRSATAITNGTVGVWSAKQGLHSFDDLLVKNSLGDTLLSEDFEKFQTGPGPYGWVDYDRDFEAIPVLANDIPDSLYSVLLSHSPDYAPFAAEHGFDLVLSGHTHGGQVRLPFIGALYVQISLGQKFVQGQQKIDNTIVYITRGIGTIWMPLRFLCPPEITHIHLSR